jgi:hypothetical protein
MDAIMNLVDMDGDGSIDYSEFAQMGKISQDMELLELQVQESTGQMTADAERRATEAQQQYDELLILQAEMEDSQTQMREDAERRAEALRQQTQESLLAAQSEAELVATKAAQEKTEQLEQAQRQMDDMLTAARVESQRIIDTTARAAAEQQSNSESSPRPSNTPANDAATPARAPPPLAPAAVELPVVPDINEKRGVQQYDVKRNGKKLELQVGSMGLQLFKSGKPFANYLYASMARWEGFPKDLVIEFVDGSKDVTIKTAMAEQIATDMTEHAIKLAAAQKEAKASGDKASSQSQREPPPVVSSVEAVDTSKDDVLAGLQDAESDQSTVEVDEQLDEPEATARQQDRAEAVAKFRREAVARHDGTRDFFNESVDALKAASGLDSKVKKSPADEALTIDSAKAWLTAQRYLASALLSDAVTDKVKSALRTKQQVIDERLASVSSRLSPGQMASIVVAFETEEASHVAQEVAAATRVWDAERDAVEAAQAAAEAAAAADADGSGDDDLLAGLEDEREAAGNAIEGPTVYKANVMATLREAFDRESPQATTGGKSISCAPCIFH